MSDPIESIPLRRKLARGLALLLWLGVVAAAGLGLFGRFFPDDLSTDGRLHNALAAVKFVACVLPVHLALACGVAAAAAAGIRRWRLLAAAGLVAVGLMAWVLWPAAGRPAGGEGSFRVMTANVYFKSLDPASLIEAVEAVRPDVLVIQEYTPAHDAALRQGLAGSLPWVSYGPVDHPDGSAVFSRFPLRERPFGGPLQQKAQRFVLDVGGVNVTLYNVHPSSVGSYAGIVSNRRQNREIAALATAEPGPTIVAGDFNAPPTSASLGVYDAADLASVHGLAGTGLGHTWPVGRLPFFVPGVRIDDVRLSPELTATAAGLGPAVASDHRPVWADVTFSR